MTLHNPLVFIVLKDRRFLKLAQEEKWDINKGLPSILFYTYIITVRSSVYWHFILTTDILTYWILTFGLLTSWLLTSEVLILSHEDWYEPLLESTLAD